MVLGSFIIVCRAGRGVAAHLLALFALLSLLGALLLLGLALLEQSLRYQDLILGRNAPRCSVSCHAGHVVLRGRSAAQWSAGSHAFSIKHLECLISGTFVSADKTSLSESAKSLERLIDNGFLIVAHLIF